MYLVGIDGGGTKTECVIASTEGEILAVAESGSSCMRTEGVESAVLNIEKAVREAFLNIERKEVTVIFVGLSSFEEEYKEEEEEIKSKLRVGIKDFLKEESKVIIGSDQEVAFRRGTESKNGVAVIAGTGSVARGWNNGVDFKTSGWGWLVDKSGAFQIGQEALKKTAEAFDGRIEKTILTEAVMNFFSAKDINDINKVVYRNNFINTLSSLSVVVDSVAKEGDVVALQILKCASESLAISAKNTIEKLSFQEKFPVVLSGSVFKSNVFLTFFKNYLSDFNFNMDIIIPNDLPAMGAVKLAKENYEKFIN